MAENLEFGKIRVELGGQVHSAPIGPQTPFRIAVLGDFSGRANRGIIDAGSAIASRRPRVVDRDNVDALPAQLEVGLSRTIFDPQGRPVPLSIGTLDDFLPDRLFASLSPFSDLRQLRRRLLSSATFAEAAAEVRAWGAGRAKTAAGPTTPAEGAANDPSTAATGQDLEAIFGKPLEEIRSAARDPADAVDWQKWIAEIAAPYVRPGADPQQAELVACVDSATSRAMSALLHGADFQSLEAAWRGLDFLVRGLDTDASLKVQLIDLSQAELQADLLATDDLTDTGIYRLLVEPTMETPGGQAWALLLGIYRFGSADEDAEILGRLARIADAAGAPFVSAAKAELVGCPHPERTADARDWTDQRDSSRWSALRRMSEANRIGLLWPRFLLRLPYGRRTTPIEAFAYEETAEAWQHDDYLWGNPAYLFGVLLGNAFSQSGWRLRPGEASEVRGLPQHIRDVDGEPEANPSGELLLNERAVARVVARGVMPVVSVRGEDVVRLTSVRAVNGEPLCGRWPAR